MIQADKEREKKVIVQKTMAENDTSGERERKEGSCGKDPDREWYKKRGNKVFNWKFIICHQILLHSVVEPRSMITSKMREMDVKTSRGKICEKKIKVEIELLCEAD